MFLALRVIESFPLFIEKTDLFVVCLTSFEGEMLRVFTIFKFARIFLRTIASTLQIKISVGTHEWLESISRLLQDICSHANLMGNQRKIYRQEEKCIQCIEKRKQLVYIPMNEWNERRNLCDRQENEEQNKIETEKKRLESNHAVYCFPPVSRNAVRETIQFARKEYKNSPTRLLRWIRDLIWWNMNKTRANFEKKIGFREYYHEQTTWWTMWRWNTLKNVQIESIKQVRKRTIILKHIIMNEKTENKIIWRGMRS